MHGRQDTAYLPIKDYALIGNCGSAALVSRHGSIDWLCWPRFDSPSLFAALLDHENGGCFYVRPRAGFTVERRYVENTNVLETTFTTDTGVLTLTDLMPVDTFEEYNRHIWSDHEVLRRLICEEGEVEVDVFCNPRYDYGRVAPRFEDRGAHGYFYNYNAEVIIVRSDLPLTLSEDRSCLHAVATLRAGERGYLALAHDQEEPAALPLLGDFAEERIVRTLDYWRQWAARCNYEGPFRDAVVRSALTLKLMTYSRSGAIVAAPTTSLPEALGGERNWDYRYCWLRDASFTLRVLFELGYDLEGKAFLEWLLHATGGTQPDLRILYDVYGNIHIEEKVLDHLEGYRGSRPVRIGNGAKDQVQLDIYGEVVGGAFEFIKHNGGLSRGQQKILRKLGEKVCACWREPDNGIWEKRGERQHHTYSKAMCWVALDRLVELCENDYLKVDVAWFREVQAEIHDEIETRGYNEELESYVSIYDGAEVDASLLLLPVYGYNEATDPRMQSTFARIQERLARGSLMYRYEADHTDDGFSSTENAFGLCSFWDEIFLAQSGKVEQAKEHFEQMLHYANDVGLFAEEIDPATGAALGNFPQAFTHVGLINAALTIAEVEGRREEEELEEKDERTEEEGTLPART